MPSDNEKMYVSFKRRLVVGFSLLVVLLILSLSWKITSTYFTEKNTVKKQTKNFAQAMGAHVVGAIQLIDFSLDSTANTIKSLSRESDASHEIIKKALSGIGRMPNPDFWILFIDAEGRGVAASNNLPVNGVSFVDRPYFSAHAKGVDIGLFVGEPSIGRLSKKRVFYLSRGVTSETGKFIGVVAAPVDAKIFADVFVNALFQPELSITLAHLGGKVIARVPKFDETFSSNIMDSPLFRNLQIARSGTYEARSVIDNDTRIYSYAVLDKFLLVISVGMADRSWINGLHDGLMVGLVGIAVIIAILFFSGHFALRSYQKLANNEGSLRRLNHELQIAQVALSRIARIDSLTGLPNRNHLYDRLTETLARGERNNTQVYCLYLDIDDFKQVNDQLGHAGGDELLKQFGARVQACVRQTDMVARLAGDEFVVVIEGLDQQDTPKIVAEKIIETMQSPFTLEGERRIITTSIGIATAQIQHDDADFLLKKADIALYAAKRLGKNLYRQYEEIEAGNTSS